MNLFSENRIRNRLQLALGRYSFNIEDLVNDVCDLVKADRLTIKILSRDNEALMDEVDRLRRSKQPNV